MPKVRHHNCVADTQPYRSRKRGFETMTDMLRSLVLISVVVLLFAYFCDAKGGSGVITVDPTGDIVSAAQYGEFAVIAPKGLSKGWRPTSSGLLRNDNSDTGTPVGLTIGYVTPKTQFARFTVRMGDPQVVLYKSVDGASIDKNPSGAPITINAQSFTPFATDKGQGLYAITGTGATSVVTVLVGSASLSELKQLAASLQPVPKKTG